MLRSTRLTSIPSAYVRKLPPPISHRGASEAEPGAQLSTLGQLFIRVRPDIS